MSDKSVERLLGVFVIVSFSRKAHTHAEGHVTNTGFPNFFVQLGINAYIRSTHHLVCEFANLLNGARSFPLESIFAQFRVQVNGVLASHHFGSFRLTVFRLLKRALVLEIPKEGVMSRSSKKNQQHVPLCL